MRAELAKKVAQVIQKRAAGIWRVRPIAPKMVFRMFARTVGMSADRGGKRRRVQRGIQQRGKKAGLPVSAPVAISQIDHLTWAETDHAHGGEALAVSRFGGGFPREIAICGIYDRDVSAAG